jgi:hypothetical protein
MHAPHFPIFELAFPGTAEANGVRFDHHSGTKLWAMVTSRTCLLPGS